MSQFYLHQKKTLKQFQCSPTFGSEESFKNKLLKESFAWLKLFWEFLQASNPIKMTENWLEYDQKNFTQTNLNVWTWLKYYTNENLTSSLTKKIIKIDEYDRKFIFGQIHMLMFVFVVIFVIFSVKLEGELSLLYIFLSCSLSKVT